MDPRGQEWTPWIDSGPPSKPLVGILGDVDGRIVPVAPPPLPLERASTLAVPLPILSATKNSLLRVK
jgi:hypothetical protein